ncbi:MAG: DUF4091 domain-containing protein [Clostridia bacterium]|nr:DUF4091 domain-containing protein [Clostridia bacterium]
MAKKVCKKILSTALCALLASSAVACNGGGSTPPPEKGEAEVFGAYFTDKILKDVAVEEEQKLPSQFTFLTAQGEAEAAQIVMTATKNIAAYSLSVADLTCEATGETFKKENFETFHQKYIEVTSNSNVAGGEDGPLGWYPDILLPMEKAVEYHENTVKKDENQSVVVQANVPANQKAGLYSGSFTLTIDGETKSIPVELQVYNTQMPDVPTLDSKFGMSREELIYGEGDNTLEMYAKYCDKLIEYNCMPYYLPASSGDYAGYAQQVKKYYDKISGYSLPAAYKNECVDKEVLTNYIMEIVKLSLQDGVNYISKARNGYGYIDEPLLNGTWVRANKLSKQFIIDLELIAEEVKALDIPDHATCTKEEIAESVKAIKNIVTAEIDPLLEEVKHFCPLWSEFDNEVNRQQYLDSGNDYWWYGCNQPTNPYPTYHTDDMNGLVSSRVSGFMAEAYGVQGVLFWESILYRGTVLTGGFNKVNTDVYETAMQFEGTNGDGVLFYPGARYGMDEPIVSNRLVAIRDSFEDYDLLKNVRDAYTASEKDATPLLNWLGESLYNGTKVHANSEDLVAVKKALMNAYLLATEKQVFITDVAHSSDGYTFHVDAPANAQVKYNGSAISNPCKLLLSKNENTAKITCGEYTFAYTVEGKKERVYDADTLQKFTVQTAVDSDATVRPNKALTVQQVDGSSIGLSGKAMEIAFGSDGVDYAWSITADDFSKIINKRTRNFSLSIYNPLDTDLTVVIRGNNVQGINFPITEVIVKANGVTEIQLGDLSTLKWSVHRKIASLDFSIAGDIAVEKLYLISASKTEVSK